MSPTFDKLPIISHEDVADVRCCGCLIVRERDGQAEVLCNECAAVIRTVPLEDVDAVMTELAGTDVFCSAVCQHCGAVNTFPGMTAIEAFICRECNQGVAVPASTQ
jgi:hypothetical protein